MVDWIIIPGICASVAAFVLYILTPKSDIPGPLPLPIIGNLLTLSKAKPGKHYLLYQKLAKQYGGIYRLFMGRQLIVRLNTYDLIKEAFVQHADVFSGRPDVLQNNGKGLICGDGGDEFKKLRAVFYNKLKSLDTLVTDKRKYEDRISRETTVLIKHLNELSGQPIGVNKLFFAASCNIILDILFGIRHEYEDDMFNRLVEADLACSKDLPPISKLSLLFPFLQSVLPKVEKSPSMKLIHSYAGKLIKESRNTFDETNIQCLLDTIIQAEKNGELKGEAFSEENISCAISDLLFAHIGNIGVVLSWGIIYMIRYPKIQEKCREEIKKVVGPGRNIRLTDKDRLKYVQATIKEVLRIAATAPITVPHLATADAKLKGYHIPKGTILVGDIMAAYITNLEDGEQFIPERFFDEHGELMLTKYNLNFGIGPRNCLGEFLAEMEIFLLFSSLIQNFVFSKVSPSDDFNFDGTLGLLMTPPDFKVKILKT